MRSTGRCRGRRALAPCALSLALSAIGCSEDAHKDGESLAEPDGGDMPRLDAGSTDADHDGGPDGDGGLRSECQGDVFSFAAARAPWRNFSASASGNRLELVYLESACGGTRGTNYAQGAEHVTLQTAGEPSAAQALVNLGLTSCYTTQEPSVVAQPDGSYALFFTSNREGSQELFSLDGAQPASSVRLTDDPMHSAAALSARSFGSQSLVVYSREPVSTTIAAADIMTMLPGFAPTVLVPADAGFHAVQTTLTALAPTLPGSSAAAVAWVSDAPEHAGVYLQLIHDQGSAAGSVQMVTSEVSTAITLAAGKQGGAIAYLVGSTESQQVRFRSVSTDGTLGEEVPLTLGNQSVREVALAGYSTGYVLAYRWLGGEGQRDSIRVLFLDAHGRIGRSRFVAEAVSGGMGVDVHVAQDGRLWVLWEDAVTSTPVDGGSPEVEGSIRVARLLCP